MTLAVVVAGSASALGPLSSTTSSSTQAASTTTSTSTTKTPADQFIALNGSVNAASDHEIVASSAFPNYTTGAVDNYYSMAKSHVDNSPFAEGTASPADTGPVGQTAAAGNFQQPQYADARWPGGPDKQTYGSQGGPFAEAAANTYLATSDASEPSRGLSSPGLSTPKGFDSQLQRALAAFKATWLNRLVPKQPTPAVTTPKATTTVPKPPVTPPATTVTTPLGTVTTPRTSAGSGNTTPPAAVPAPTDAAHRPDGPAAVDVVGIDVQGRRIAAHIVDAGETRSSDRRPQDGHDQDRHHEDRHHDTTDTTSTSTTKTDASTPTYALVTSGESRLGRVTLGGGQIVIEGIHVKASIANDGDPAYSASVSVASATIGGIPVTIDDNGRAHCRPHPGRGLQEGERFAQRRVEAGRHPAVPRLARSHDRPDVRSDGHGLGPGLGLGHDDEHDDDDDHEHDDDPERLFGHDELVRSIERHEQRNVRSDGNGHRHHDHRRHHDDGSPGAVPPRSVEHDHDDELAVRNEHHGEPVVHRHDIGLDEHV